MYLNRKGPVFPRFPASDRRGSNEIQDCFPSYSANSAPTEMPNKFPFRSFAVENSFSKIPSPFSQCKSSAFCDICYLSDCQQMKQWKICMNDGWKIPNSFICLFLVFLGEKIATSLGMVFLSTVPSLMGLAG